MKKSDLASRRRQSLMKESKRVTKEEYFAERAARGDIKKALQVLKRAGKGNPPLPGNELRARSRRRPPTRRRSRSR